MIDGLAKCLDAEFAKRILKFRADSKLQKHIDQLADKCTEGMLTPDEHAEYGACVKLDTFVAIRKSKLRQRLARSGE